MMCNFHHVCSRYPIPTVVASVYKHNCVLSNSGLSNALTETGICMSLKSDFYFPFHSSLNTKSALPNLSVHGIWCWSVDTCGHHSLKTAEIGIRTSLKSANYFRFVSQIGVDALTFLSHLQNLVKIGKELWLIETKSGIRTPLKFDFYFRFHSPLNTKLALLNFICRWDLVLTCWKMWSSEPEYCKNRHPHISKISKLLPVCLTNSRRCDHISEPLAKFGENR